MISPQDFIHPEDEAARRNMEAIPGFAAAVKAFLKLGMEQYYHGINMASKIRLSEKQLPELYRKLPPICQKLNIVEPEFYLEMNPAPNAYTFGDSRIFLTITSGLVEYLTEEEVNAVIAHECGHIACRHVLYHTMANLIKAGADLFGLLGVLTTPIQLGLLYWSRRSELSADRAAAAAMGSAKPVIETMVRLREVQKLLPGT
jgi:Zn-dependent protease with chaperone function